MFEGSGLSKSLDEKLFNEWLEKGRASKMGYKYLLIVWDAYEGDYNPVYLEDRSAIDQYDRSSIGRERLVAAYDLYSESSVA